MVDPAYAHLHEDFHVLVEYEGTADGRNSAFRVADSLIRTVLSGGTIATTGLFVKTMTSVNSAVYTTYDRCLYCRHAST
jgi:hypothetical protein